MFDEASMMNALGALLNQQAQNYEKQLQVIMDRLAFHSSSPSSDACRERSIAKLNVPDFHGRPTEDVGSWLFILKQNLNAAEITESRRPLIASSYLRDSALQWYRRRILEKGEMTYQEFEAEFQTMFLPHNHQEILRDKLDALKQRGKLHEYVTSFMSLMNQIYDMSEADKIHAFKRGLAPRTKAEIGYAAPKTLHSAIELAQGYDSNFFSAQKEYVPKYQKHPRQMQDQSYQKYEPMEINSARANADQRPDIKFCKYCKRRGHMINECRTKARAHASVNQSKTEDLPNSEFMRINVFINGTPVHCLVDTGANKSIVSPETAKKCNVEILPTPATITLADGTNIRPVGTTSETMVQAEETQCKMDLMVMPLNYDALLGMDFLLSTGATIDVINKRLLFSKKTELNTTIDEQQKASIIESNPVHRTEDEFFLDELWSLEIQEKEFHILNDNISTTEKDQLSSLILKNKHSFTTCIADLGCCRVKKYNIKTSTEDPIFIRPYRKSLKERNLIQEEVNKMLAAGIIRESKSPWSSPVILINKPDGSFRFCTDYRQLNKITPKDPFPLPRIDDIFDRLSGSKWFSTLDLKSGYWQVQLDEASIPKSAFSTPDGHYEYLRLPFGMKNAPAEFSRIMSQVLGNLSFVEIYLDDITVHSRSFAQHLEHLGVVFHRLQDADVVYAHLSTYTEPNPSNKGGFSFILLSNSSYDINHTTSFLNE